MHTLSFFFLFLFNQANHILIRRAHVNLISDLRQQSSSLTQPQVFSTGMTRAKGALSLTSDAWRQQQQQPYHITLPSSHILLLRPTLHLLLPLTTYDTLTLFHYTFTYSHPLHSYIYTRYPPAIGAFATAISRRTFLAASGAPTRSPSTTP